MRIAFVTLPVTDQDRAKAFYADALGWEVTYDEVGAQGRWIDLMPPGGGCAIALVAEERPPMQGLVVEVDDLDRVHAECSARGVAFTSTPTDRGYARLATFDDPDGNSWTLMQTPVAQDPSAG
jgi:predicted enzyme related to lactoylglutathione lyase